MNEQINKENITHNRREAGPFQLKMCFLYFLSQTVSKIPLVITLSSNLPVSN